MKKLTTKPVKKSNTKTAIIIGGGIGGLCTAARLLKNGYQVTVIEKEAKIGGRANRIMKSGYFRPHNKSKNIKNLYFVGASTYPGGGIPMVTLSAKLVTERILQDVKK